jgi:hypothetical protein
MKHDVDICGEVVEGRKTGCSSSSFCVDASETKEKLAYITIESKQQVIKQKGINRSSLK